DNPQSWNQYAYVYNNPMVFVDRNGQCAKPIHEKIIDQAFQNLTADQRQILKGASANMDSLLGRGPVGTLKKDTIPKLAASSWRRVRCCGSGACLLRWRSALVRSVFGFVRVFSSRKVGTYRMNSEGLEDT